MLSSLSPLLQKHQAPPEPDVVVTRGSSRPRPLLRNPSPPIALSLRALADSTSPKTRSGGYEMPILFVDVKLKDGAFDRISVHRGDDIAQVGLTFFCKPRSVVVDDAWAAGPRVRAQAQLGRRRPGEAGNAAQTQGCRQCAGVAAAALAGQAGLMCCAQPSRSFEFTQNIISCLAMCRIISLSFKNTMH